jgi:hypothetical protein
MNKLKKQMYAIWLILFAGVLLAACGPNTAVLPQASPPPREPELMAALRLGGHAVESLGPFSQPFMPVTGQRIEIDGAVVELYEFSDEDAAQSMAADISADGSQIGRTVVDFVAPPHFYRDGRFIILYVGEESQTIMLLESVLGPPFAER